MAEFQNLAVSEKLFIGSYGTVTQGTSVTTGVTINTARGQITTFAQTLAAAGEVEFTVTCAACHADSVVNICVASGPSDSEHVLPFVSSVSEGAFTICLTNLAASNQADGAVAINYVIL